MSDDASGNVLEFADDTTSKAFVAPKQHRGHLTKNELLKEDGSLAIARIVADWGGKHSDVFKSKTRAAIGYRAAVLRSSDSSSSTVSDLPQVLGIVVVRQWRLCMTSEAYRLATACCSLHPRRQCPK